MFTQLDLFTASIEEERKSSLTPRQWALYRLIRKNSLEEGRKTTQKEICEVLAHYGYVYKESNNTSDHCSAIWNDVMENNLSIEHDKLIITKDYEYWIGSKEETKAFIRKLWNDIKPRLKRYLEYIRKVDFDGQGRLFDKNLKPLWDTDYLDDSRINAELFHSCFNDYSTDSGEDDEIH